MLNIIRGRIDPNLTIGIGAYESLEKIEDVANSIDFCNVEVFNDSAKIISALKKGEIDAIVRGSGENDCVVNRVDQRGQEVPG